jgi:hypothetical protein
MFTWPSSPFWARWRGVCARLRPLWAHLCQQLMAREVDVGQGQCCERTACILGQAAIAYLRKTPQSLDHRKHMLDTGTNLRLIAVLRTPELV